jgi:hypothetical protein
VTGEGVIDWAISPAGDQNLDHLFHLSKGITFDGVSGACIVGAFQGMEIAFGSTSLTGHNNTGSQLTRTPFVAHVTSDGQFDWALAPSLSADAALNVNSNVFWDIAMDGRRGAYAIGSLQGQGTYGTATVSTAFDSEGEAVKGAVVVHISGITDDATTSNTGTEDEDPCFPPSAMVRKADGTFAYVGELKEGDEIVAATADGTLTTDTVSLLSIAKPEAHGTFLTLTTTSNATLTITAGHHLPIGPICCSTLKKAKDVEIGEAVWVAAKDGKAAIVTTVDSKKVPTTNALGLHSPVLVNGGFPVVDGVVTSFDSIEKVTLAKHGLAPLLKACKATGTCETFRSMFIGVDERGFIASENGGVSEGGR